MIIALPTTPQILRYFACIWKNAGVIYLAIKVVSPTVLLQQAIFECFLFCWNYPEKWLRFYVILLHI